MTTSLVGRRVVVWRWLAETQPMYAHKVGRVVAVSATDGGKFFRCVVAVPRMGLATFDAGDLVPVSWWTAVMIRLGLVTFTAGRE